MYHTVSVGDLVTLTQLAGGSLPSLAVSGCLLAVYLRDAYSVFHDRRRVGTSPGNVPGASDDPHPTSLATHYHPWL